MYYHTKSSYILSSQPAGNSDSLYSPTIQSSESSSQSSDLCHIRSQSSRPRPNEWLALAETVSNQLELDSRAAAAETRLFAIRTRNILRTPATQRFQSLCS
jgi:hypothetical protein